MTTFDGSHKATPAPFASPDDVFNREVDTPDTFDALTALREQMAERADQADTTCYVDVPGLPWRLVCANDFPYSHYARWQKASLPANQRNRGRRGPNLLDMDQAMLSRFVLLGTCQGIEYRNSAGEWVEVLDAHRQPVKPDSPELMSRFDEVDPGVFLRRLFGGDAAVMRAGEVVMRAAGWLEDESDDVDPTV